MTAMGRNFGTYDASSIPLLGRTDSTSIWTSDTSMGIVVAAGVHLGHDIAISMDLQHGSCMHPVTISTSVITSTPAPTSLPCDNDALPFSAASTVLCVPHRLFPATNVRDCFLQQTWWQLRTLDPDLSTGGLGKEMMLGEFEVWICTR